MSGTRRTVAIILLSAGLVFTGNGLLQTMLPMRAETEGFSTAMIGVLGTAYFGGFIAGCVLGPALIKAVGHIRAFAGVVALLAALILLLPLWVHPHAWASLRFLTGICPSSIPNSRTMSSRRLHKWHGRLQKISPTTTSLHQTVSSPSMLQDESRM